ncbi:MAG: ATP synthase F1 subunit epsilon [Nitriliruptorales bacterium]|nr:ATP synthase F1 subunit epsilon [Nitriliruptorales bacterium]
MATMQVDIVTPEESLFSGEATEVFARSQEGEIGILPGHQPALLALTAGSPVRVRPTGEQEQSFALAGGFLEFRENRLTVLADGLAET